MSDEPQHRQLTPWREMLDELVAFIAAHGHARIPNDYRTAKGRFPGRWLYEQRKAHRANTLDDERAAQLAAVLGPRWATPHEAYWDAMFAALTEFAAQHGHARVPQNHVSRSGIPLGTWVGNQRSRHQQNTLDPARAARLEALPGWAWRDSRADRWERGFVALAEYVAEHGHARVPGSHINDDGHRLGAWVTDQRRDQRRNRLDLARAARLEALPGWAWSGSAGHQERLDQRWERGFTALTYFVAEHGHADVPRLHTTTDNFGLGDWVDNQRASHQDNRLDPARAARLEALPGWVWRESREDLWERLYAALAAYVAEHGHARFPNDYVTSDGVNLGQWARDQRRKYRQGKVNAQRVARLEALPGWAWRDRLDEQWERGFTALAEFVAQHGHANVPSRHTYSGSFHLGGWVAAQHRKHRRGELEAGRTARLEALPGWVWRRRDHTPGVSCGWESSFTALTQFVDEHGHARVPPAHITGDGIRLGQWVNAQRYTYRQGALDADRAAALETLVGWVWGASGEQRWERGFAALTHFVDEHGHTRVPYGHISVDGFRLGQWVYTQRYTYRQGALDADRAARLQALPGWVWHHHARNAA